MLRLSLQLHKWIALIVGVQVIGWVLGGLIMVSLPIETVRSQQHIAQVKMQPLDTGKIMPMEQVIEKAGLGNVTGAQLKSTPRGAIWSLTTGARGEAWYDALTGENVDEITDAQAKLWAAQAYQGPGKPVKVEYLEDPPAEAGVDGTLYRVTFDDPERTSFYLSAYTGEVESRRSNVWRFYSVFYQIHIMNFSGGQNYNHPLIVIAAALTLMVTVTGVILLWIRLSRDFVGWRTRRKAA